MNGQHQERKLLLAEKRQEKNPGLFYEEAKEDYEI